MISMRKRAASDDAHMIGPQIVNGVLDGLSRSTSRETDRNGRALKTSDSLRLADAAVSLDPDAAADIVARALEGGASWDETLLHCISGAAAELGERWTRDELDFVEVTLGCCRLQDVVASYGEGDALSTGRGPRPYGVLLAPAPKERHTIGLVMLSDFFRRAGWSVTLLTASEGDDLERIVSTRWFDAVGLSLGRKEEVDVLARTFRALKKLSRNPNLVTLAGGPALSCDPALRTAAKADVTAERADAVVAAVSDRCAGRLARSA